MSSSGRRSVAPHHRDLQSQIRPLLDDSCSPVKIVIPSAMRDLEFEQERISRGYAPGNDHSMELPAR